MNLYTVLATEVNSLAKTYGTKVEERAKKDTSLPHVKNQINSQPGSTHQEKLLNHIISNSPHPSYNKWLVHHYASGGISKLEDLDKTKASLNLFHKHKEKLPNKDLYSYKGFLPLSNAVDHLAPVKTNKEHSKDYEANLFKTGKATLVHNSKDHKVIIPHTEEASNHFGKNTKWCTSATNSKNYFEEYSPHTHLLYALHKPSNTRHALSVPKKDMNEGKYSPLEAFDQEDNTIKPREFLEHHKEAAESIAKHIKSPLHKAQLGLPVEARDVEKALGQHNTPMNRAKVGHKEHLDKLQHDENLEVRAQVAQHGHKEHLDKLQHDKESWVRAEVAKHGYKEHLDQLKNDKDPYVRVEVAGHGHKEHLDKLQHDEYRGVRGQAAMHGYKEHLDKLQHDKDPWVRREVAKRGHKEYLDKLQHDEDPYVRAEVAKHGHKEHLDKLKNDKDPEVRAQVAQHGHKEHLDKLQHDKHPYVRAEVARHGRKEDLDKLQHDEYPYVRVKVATHGHKEHLDQLVNDEYPHVREKVARHGHKEHLDKLQHDENPEVREIAKRRLKELSKG